jgi:hypothetical protein
VYSKEVYSCGKVTEKRRKAEDCVACPSCTIINKPEAVVCKLCAT